MDAPSRITVLANEQARNASADRYRVLRSAFARAGLDVQFERLKGEALMAAAERAASQGRALVAAGGDGTVSSVAAVAVRTGSPLGVVPLGTLNHFARDAGIPLSVDEAVAAIATGHTECVDIGDVNGRTFLNNFSLGAYPRLVWERQVEQDRGRSKWTASVLGALRTWRRHRLIAVRIALQGTSVIHCTPFVFVGNGTYHAEGPGLGSRGSILGSRGSINDGRLTVYVAPDIRRWEMVALALRAILKRLTPDVKLESFSVSELEIALARREVSVALDGELMMASPPFHCSVRPRALRLIVAADK